MKTWLALNRHFKELVDACTVFNFICQELSTYTFLLGTIFCWINLHFLGVVKTVIFLWALNQHIHFILLNSMQRLIISPLNSLDSFHIVIRTLIFQLLNIVNSFCHTSQESDIWLFKCSNICKFDFNRRCSWVVTCLVATKRGHHRGFVRAIYRNLTSP